MIEIRKLEAFAVRKVYPDYVKKSASKKPKFYVVEKREVLAYLEKFRESITISSHTK